MNRTILLDTGPLVALLNRHDHHHEWAAERLGDLTPPFHTCEAVLAEACHLLRRIPGGIAAVLRLVGADLVQPSFRLEQEIGAVERLLNRYANVPVSLADACLVRQAELHFGSQVVTFDSDFRIYRINGRQVVPTIMPPPP